MSKKQIREMVQMAILIAIMLIFAFTPLGYLKAGPIEITFMIIPVSIGAILVGPIGGAILGFVFGITSFIQCFTGSVFGAFLFDLSPVLTFVICLIPRILCGWLSGLLFRSLRKIDRTKVFSYLGASLATALLNTFFFMGSILLFFWHNDAFVSGMEASGLPVDSVWRFLIAFVGINGVVEAAVSFVVGSAIGKALMHVLNKED